MCKFSIRGLLAHTAIAVACLSFGCRENPQPIKSRQGDAVNPQSPAVRSAPAMSERDVDILRHVLEQEGELPKDRIYFLTLTPHREPTHTFYDDDGNRLPSRVGTVNTTWCGEPSLGELPVDA